MDINREEVLEWMKAYNNANIPIDKLQELVNIIFDVKIRTKIPKKDRAVSIAEDI